MRAVFEIDFPKNCLMCDLAWHEVSDCDGESERLYCLPLTAMSDENVSGDFLGIRDDCPLKVLED